MTTNNSSLPFSSSAIRASVAAPRLRPLVKFAFATPRKDEIGRTTVDAGTPVTIAAIRNPLPNIAVAAKQTGKAEPQRGWLCTATPFKGEAITEEVAIVNGNYKHMYPGAVYDYQQIGQGSYNTLPYARKPLVITAEGQKFAKPMQTIPAPSMATYNVALAALKADQNKVIGSRSYGEARQIRSESELYLMTSGSASFMGFGGSNKLDFKSTNSTYKYYFNIVQAYYTVNVDDSINEPTDFFVTKSEQPNNKDAVDEAKIDPNWVFVDSVTYGRMVHVVLESSESFESLKLDVQAFAKFMGAEAHAQFDLEKAKKSTTLTIKVGTVGGDANKIARVQSATIDTLRADINDFFTGNNDEEAIAYTLRTLDGSAVGSHMMTDFVAWQCVPQPISYTVRWDGIKCVANDDGIGGGADECKLFVRVRGWDGSHNDIMDTAKVNEKLLNFLKSPAASLPIAKLATPWTFVRGSEGSPFKLSAGDKQKFGSSLEFPYTDDKMKIGIRADVLEFDTGDNDDFEDGVDEYMVKDIGAEKQVRLVTRYEGSRIDFNFTITANYLEE